jgi:hypothetical protein
MTIGFGPRTIIGTWLRAWSRMATLNVLGFRRHWQIHFIVHVNVWRR